MAETQTPTPEVDYKAEYEKLQADHAKLKTSFDKTSSDLASAKKQLAETQTDEQRRQAEMQEREARYQQIERENSLYQYREKLSKFVKDEKTLDKLANLYADGEIAKAIELIASYLAAERVEMEKQIKAELMATNADPTPGSGKPTLTREQIAQISDPQERQKAISENLHLYGF